MSFSPIPTKKKYPKKKKPYLVTSPTQYASTYTDSVITNTSSSITNQNKLKFSHFCTGSNILSTPKHCHNNSLSQLKQTKIRINSSLSNTQGFTVNQCQRMLNKNGLLKLNFSFLVNSVKKEAKLKGIELSNKKCFVTNKKLILKPKQPYPMIINTKYNKHYITDYSNPNSSRFNSKSKQVLKSEARDIFMKPFSLIKPNPLLQVIDNEYDHYAKTERNNYEEEKLLIARKLRKIFFNDKRKSLKLSNDDNKNNDANNKKEYFDKAKRTIIKSANQFKRMNITLDEYYSKYKPISKPFSNENTHHLLSAIKNKNIKDCKRLLINHRCIVLDYDYFKQTPLHWAAKRNFFEIIPDLVLFGASVDAKDCIGRTPVHIAIKSDNCEAALMLFMESASPFILDDEGKKPVDYCTNSLMKSLCDRATLLHIVHSMGKQKDFYKKVKRGFMYYVKNELPYNIMRRLIYMIDDDEE